MKKIFAIVLTLALLVTGCGVMAMAEAAEADTAVGPLHFVTTDVYGNEVTSEELFSQYDLTLVNLWESWCPPCRNELATLERIYEELKDKGIGIVGVSVFDDSFDFDRISDLDYVLELREENGVTYPMIAYTEEFLALEIGSRPLSVFVDRDGNIVAIADGIYSDEDLAEYREKLCDTYMSNIATNMEYFNSGAMDDWKDSEDEEHRAAYESIAQLAGMDEETLRAYCMDVAEASVESLVGDTFQVSGAMAYDDWMEVIREFYAAATGSELD